MNGTFERYINTYIYSKYVEAKRAGQGQIFIMTLKGWSDIERAISDLSDIEKDKAIRAGLRSGGLLLKRKGRQRLKQRLKGNDTDGLYNAFVVRIKKRSLGALVGFNRKGHHAHLVDKGTTKRKHPITGTSGVMPANYFWNDTAEQDWRQAMEKVMDGIERAVFRIKMRQA